MQPSVSISRKSGSNPFDNLKKIMSSHAAYVGIPASSTRDRKAQLLKMAGKISSPKSKRKNRILEVAAETDINNAQLLFIQSKGSIVKHIPARPVLEPAIAAEGNRQPIARELAGASKAAMNGDVNGMMTGLKRASLAGQNAARSWFTDDRNHWKQNAEETINRKGSDRPLIDTSAMRNAIIGLVK